MPSNFHVKNATVYEQLMGRFSSLLAPSFLDWVKADVGDAILDVGCGTGSLIGELLQRNPAANITAIDYEERFVEYSTQRFEDEQRVTIEQGDAEDLKFADDTFSTTFSMLTVHFVSDPVQALREMKRVTRPGGTVAATVWEDGKMQDHEMYWRAVSEVAPEVANMRTGNGMTHAAGLANAFRDAGLPGVELTRLTIRMDYENFAQYWAPRGPDAAKTNKFLSRLPEGGIEKLHDLLRTAYLDGRSDGPRSYPATALAVKAPA